jgi:hypothetical protein
MFSVGEVVRKLRAWQKILDLSPRCGVFFLPLHNLLVPGVGTRTNDPVIISTVPRSGLIKHFAAVY